MVLFGNLIVFVLMLLIGYVGVKYGILYVVFVCVLFGM